MTRGHDGKASAYFSWLCEHAAIDQRYRRLWIRLHQRSFIWVNSRDENRVQDGLDLRDRFSYGTGIDISDGSIDGPCSVLEMLTALAIRCERDIMDDANSKDRTAVWFDAMIHNLGLDVFDDEHYDGRKIDDIIDRWMGLKYTVNGVGSPFPNAFEESVDQRKIEIWSQLNGYMNRYYIV